MNLGIFDLVGVIMLVLAGTSFVYLLRVEDKTESTRMLIWFFLCVVLSSIATIITNLGVAWDWAFAPSQDALLILGGLFLVSFAYLYPTNDQAKEARWVVAFFFAIALVALAYAGIFAIRYIANLPAELSESQLYYLLTPIMISLAVLVFFRRSIHWSVVGRSSDEIRPHEKKTNLKFLFKPNNRPAIALRNYGLSLAIGLVPVVIVVIKTSLPPVLASFLFNFGAVAAIAAVMLTYFNFAPESVTLSAKLVGISLVSFLLILGLAGVWIYESNPGVDVHSLVLTFIGLVLLSSLLVVLIFPSFFRIALLDPLDKLLWGVKTANQGDLDVQVPVQFDDEIGFLSQSFNRMISSLNDATEALKKESVILERQVSERTVELREINQQLINENLERRAAQAMLDRQLRYERALAGCSRSLLVTTDGEESQKIALTLALEHLQMGAMASRAYIFRNILDDDLGLCMSMLAEACASDIKPQIQNPANQSFPWSQLPEDMYAALSAGRPFGGPVERVFESTPQLLSAFLQQPEPLLSVQTFPILLENQWWGFIGFDDCETSREWDEDETLMLRTASEMIQNTLRRWAAEKYLKDTLENLEQRVHDRTVELTRANADLRHEIQERQRFQDELEERLEVESTLASVSDRLLGPTDLRSAIQETLADLGMIMHASSVVFIQMDSGSVDADPEFITWHAREVSSSPENREVDLKVVISWLNNILDSHKSLLIQDLAKYPDFAPPGLDQLFGCQVEDLLLTPLILDNHLAGTIACSNLKLPKVKINENTRIVEVVAGTLGSLLHREEVLNTLEERIAERTQELSAFFDMAMLAGQAQRLADIMQPVLVKIMEVSFSEAATIHLYDLSQPALKLVAQRGIPEKDRLQIQTIPIDEAMKLWIGSVNGETWSPEETVWSATFKTSSLKTNTYIPLRARSKFQGLLSCHRRADLPYSPYQLFFLNVIGELLGMAVENYQLRLKAEEIATIQERQRLARELHDAVSQSLYSLALLARSGRDAVERGDRGKLINSLELLEINSLAAVKEMRLLLYQLRSLALEAGGIAQAIETRLGLVEQRSGIQANIQIDERLQLSAQAEQEIFLLVNEALNNALKHSGASQVFITLQEENDQVMLVVRDNGCGFDPSQAFAGMGLTNMHERASALDGQIHISSQPGQGTQISVEFPRIALVHEEGSFDGKNPSLGR